MSRNVFAWLRTPGVAAAAGVAALLLANAASAQECEDDGDCGDGYVCESRGTQPCVSAPTPACPPGDEKCTQAKPAPVPECDPKEYKACAPAPCTQDSDCPDSMVCFAYGQGTCSGSAPAAVPCPAGQKCEPPPPPKEDCTTKTISQCTPRYTLPCEEDSDCGDGFKCKEQFSPSCSGSSSSGGADTAGTAGTAGKGGSTPPVDAGMAQDGGSSQPVPVPAEPDCKSEPTGEFWCELQVVPCADDSECPSDFECADNPNRAVCMSAGTATTPPAMGTAARDAGAATPSDGQGAGGGDDPCGDVNDGVPEKVCLPPNYYTARGASFGNDLGQAGTANSSMAAGEAKGSDASTIVPGSSPTNDAGAHNSGSHDDGSTDTKAKDSGCSVAAPGAGDASHALGLLGMLGFCALALRRRARKLA